MSPFILPSHPIVSIETTTVNNSINTALSGTALFVLPCNFIIVFLIRIHCPTSYFFKYCRVSHAYHNLTAFLITSIYIQSVKQKHSVI